MQTFNIGYHLKDPRAKMLSPLRNRAFKFDGQWFASFEGFFAGIKYPEGSEERGRAFASSFGAAQKLGQSAESEFAWWQGNIMELGSGEHKALVTAAHIASVVGDPDRIEALLATGDMWLTHEVGTPDPHYPPELFSFDLMELRKHLQKM